jgi:hypothetical protein
MDTGFGEKSQVYLDFLPYSRQLDDGLSAIDVPTYTRPSPSHLMYCTMLTSRLGHCPFGTMYYLNVSM